LNDDPRLSRESSQWPVSLYWPNSKLAGRDGNDPSVDIAKDADQRF
jgi:hypothetical protein